MSIADKLKNSALAFEKNPAPFKKEVPRNDIKTQSDDSLESNVQSLKEKHERELKELKRKLEEQDRIIKQKTSGQVRISKWQDFVPLTARVTPEQVRALDEWCLEIKRLRKDKNGERITKNTLLRCLIEHFLERSGELNYAQLTCEDDVYKEFSKMYVPISELKELI